MKREWGECSPGACFLSLLACTIECAMYSLDLKYSSEALAEFLMQNRPPGPRQKKRLAGPATKMQLPNAPVKTPFSIPFARSFIALCHDVRNSQHPIVPSSDLRLGRELGLAVRNLDTELLGACNNFYPLSR